MDGDDAQPAEDRVAVWLTAHEDRPGGLTGVLDQLARGADDVGDRTLEVTMVAAVELVFVAVRPVGRASRDGGSVFGWGLHAPRPGRRRTDPSALHRNLDSSLANSRGVARSSRRGAAPTDTASLRCWQRAREDSNLWPRVP